MNDNVDSVVQPWCPDRDPITLRPFFMWIEHPERGMVPTYGGPFDSYTLAEPDNLPDECKVHRLDIEYSCERYDHDGGYWVEGCEDPGMRVVSEDMLCELDAWDRLNTMLTCAKEHSD